MLLTPGQYNKQTIKYITQTQYAEDEQTRKTQQHVSRIDDGRNPYENEAAHTKPDVPIGRVGGRLEQQFRSAF